MEDFQINFSNDIAVVKVELVAATLRDTKLLWDELESHLIFNWNKVIMDLSSCSFIDSTFIGMIVKIFRKISQKNGQLKLVFPQITAVESFRVVGITKILECFDTLQEAEASFNHQPPVQKVSSDEKILTMQ